MSRFAERLAEGPVIVADGGTGALLSARVPRLRAPEEANVRAPEAVIGVHAAFIRAGAELIEANTFGANRRKLSALLLEDQLEEIVERGVKLAREAREISGRAVFVAGSIGPLGELEGAGVLAEVAELALPLLGDPPGGRAGRVEDRGRIGLGRGDQPVGLRHGAGPLLLRACANLGVGVAPERLGVALRLGAHLGRRLLGRGEDRRDPLAELGEDVVGCCCRLDVVVIGHRSLPSGRRTLVHARPARKRRSRTTGQPGIPHPGVAVNTPFWKNFSHAARERGRRLDEACACASRDHGGPRA